MLMNFWEKWYFPANAVLYIVGDLGNSVPEIEALIQKAFGNVPAGRERLPGSSPQGALQHGNGAVHSDSSNGAHKDDAALQPLKRKHEVGCASLFTQHYGCTRSTGNAWALERSSSDSFVLFGKCLFDEGEEAFSFPALPHLLLPQLISRRKNASVDLMTGLI